MRDICGKVLQYRQFNNFVFRIFLSLLSRLTNDMIIKMQNVFI